MLMPPVYYRPKILVKGSIGGRYPAWLTAHLCAKSDADELCAPATLLVVPLSLSGKVTQKCFGHLGERSAILSGRLTLIAIVICLSP
jgi:hypothetical protein